MSRTQRARDLDLDPMGQGRLPRAAGPEEWYLRLVANPFLAFACLLLGLFAIRCVAGRGSIVGVGAPAAVIVAVCLLPWVHRVLHYHCLDCGGTGRLTRWRMHLCPTVAERRSLGQRRRLRGPTPGVQMLLILWIFALLAAVVVGSLRSLR